jgi:YHS domain-containing protein
LNLSKRKTVLPIAACFIILSIGLTYALLPPVNVDNSGVAIKGFDPVAYFTEGRPVKGKRMFSYKWQNANWLFSSKENLALFMKNPGKYAPRYGGY